MAALKNDLDTHYYIMMKKLPLHWKIIIGLILGIIYSLVSSALGWNAFTQDWIDPFGVIFIRLLKFIAVPLVLFSIIGGVSGLPDPSKLGRMGAKTLFAYVLTTVASITVGLLLVNLLQPGEYVDEQQRVKNRLKYELWAQSTPAGKVLDGESFLNKPEYEDMVEEAQAAMKAEMSDAAVEERIQAAEQFKDAGPLQFVVDFVPDNIFAALTDSGRMLQIIFFGIFFGIMLLLIPEDKAKPVIDFVNGTNEVFLKMVEVVMEAAPFFVFALMAGVISKMASTPAEVIEIFKGLLSYSVVVVLGLFFMIFVFYPLIVSLIVGKLTYSEFFRR
ncbi:MAG TPA: cation:dicarboxylase symporter family transporter, partial [Phaeodactylibacter sp.]|nr:cation:dicarboxylase symporter family transporter [Phaeodactylibacter sp.]